MSEHKRENSQLGERIQAAYQAVQECMRNEGITCARKRVARLMRELGAVRRPRHHSLTPRSDRSAGVAPNCLDRDFTATCPREKWAGDSTAIWTYEGWLSLFSDSTKAGQSNFPTLPSPGTQREIGDSPGHFRFTRHKQHRVAHSGTVIR